MGRPSDYKEEYNEQARKLALLGATDEELADFFGVTKRTITNWKRTKEGFFPSIKRGKILADAKVSESLYHRALGYHHPEDKIFNNGLGKEPTIIPTVKHYPPDTGAAFIWLKNRRPQDWRDKSEVASTLTMKPGEHYAEFSAAIRDAANVDPKAT